MTGEFRPVNRVLAFFDPLLGSASLVVEVNHTAGVPPEVPPAPTQKEGQSLTA